MLTHGKQQNQKKSLGYAFKFLFTSRTERSVFPLKFQSEKAKKKNTALYLLFLKALAAVTLQGAKTIYSYPRQQKSSGGGGGGGGVVLVVCWGFVVVGVVGMVLARVCLW